MQLDGEAVQVLTMWPQLQEEVPSIKVGEGRGVEREGGREPGREGRREETASLLSTFLFTWLGFK